MESDGAGSASSVYLSAAVVLCSALKSVARRFVCAAQG